MALDRSINLDDMLDESEVEVLNGEQVLRIPKEQIYSGAQVRTKFNQESIIELGKTLERQQEQPIIVSPRDGKGYLVQKGERRWRGAMSNSNVTHLDCIVRKDSDPYGQLIENIQREQLEPLDVAHALVKLMNDENLNQAQLCEAIAKNKAYVSKHIKVLESPEFILEAMESNKINSIETATALRVAAKNNESKVKSFVESHDTVTVDQAIELKDTLSAKPKATSKKTAKKTSKPKALGVAVEHDGRNGLLLAKCDEVGRMAVLFEDGTIDNLEPSAITLIGYK